MKEEDEEKTNTIKQPLAAGAQDNANRMAFSLFSVSDGE